MLASHARAHLSGTAQHARRSALIAELEAHLASFYPVESRHGFSVAKLLTESVAFFVTRYDGALAGCRGIKLFDKD